MEKDRYTVFNEQKVAQKTPLIELNAVHGLSMLRDDQQVSGTGSITSTPSEFRVRHQAAGDFARLASASRGRYQPGTLGEVGIGVRFDTIPTSGDFEALWGYFDMEVSGGSNTENIENGIVFGLDVDGIFIAIYKDGTQVEKVYSEDWNGRDADAFDLTEGTIFQVEYTYYGYGSMKFKYVESNEGQQKERLLHTYSSSGATTLDNTNLQVGALVKSSNTAEDFSVYIGGRQYNVIGRYEPRRRINTARNTGVSIATTGFTPIVSVRKKSDRREIASDVYGQQTLSDTDTIVQIRLNSTLTGASWGTLQEQSSSETGLEVDTSATAIDVNTGTKIWEGFVSGSGNSARSILNNVSNLPVDVPDEGVVSLTARAINSSGTLDGVLQMQEIF